MLAFVVAQQHESIKLSFLKQYFGFSVALSASFRHWPMDMPEVTAAWVVEKKRAKRTAGLVTYIILNMKIFKNYKFSLFEIEKNDLSISIF